MVSSPSNPHQKLIRQVFCFVGLGGTPVEFSGAIPDCTQTVLGGQFGLLGIKAGWVACKVTHLPSYYTTSPSSNKEGL